MSVTRRLLELPVPDFWGEGDGHRGVGRGAGSKVRENRDLWGIIRVESRDGEDGSLGRILLVIVVLSEDVRRISSGHGNSRPLFGCCWSLGRVLWWRDVSGHLAGLVVEHSVLEGVKVRTGVSEVTTDGEPGSEDHFLLLEAETLDQPDFRVDFVHSDSVPDGVGVHLESCDEGSPDLTRVDVLRDPEELHVLGSSRLVLGELRTSGWWRGSGFSGDRTGGLLVAFVPPVGFLDQLLPDVLPDLLQVGSPGSGLLAEVEVGAARAVVGVLATVGAVLDLTRVVDSNPPVSHVGETRDVAGDLHGPFSAPVPQANQVSGHALVGFVDQLLDSGGELAKGSEDFPDLAVPHLERSPLHVDPGHFLPLGHDPAGGEAFPDPDGAEVGPRGRVRVELDLHVPQVTLGDAHDMLPRNPDVREDEFVQLVVRELQLDTRVVLAKVDIEEEFLVTGKITCGPAGSVSRSTWSSSKKAEGWPPEATCYGSDKVGSCAIDHAGRHC